jgi:MoxR-vWA-beta-propeller ternary system domain bpX4
LLPKKLCYRRVLPLKYLQPVPTFIAMALSEFITDLLTEGRVEVTGMPGPISSEDMDETRLLLEQLYQDECTHLAGTAPPFDAAAAVWAAIYLYNSIHYIVWRDIGEEEMKAGLQPWSGQYNPSSAWSADLILRHLPRLTELAKGLSPGDILVSELRSTAAQWPLSSPGVELDETCEQRPVPDHPGLRLLYLDRIIKEKDKSKLKDPVIREGVRELTGHQLSVFWPGIETD